MLALLDIDKEALDSTVEALEQKGVIVYGYNVDVTDEKKVKQVVKAVQRELGDIYMLVNNAGVVPCKPFMELSSQDVRRAVDVNALAHFWTVKAVLPSMLEDGRGKILT